MFAVDSNAFSKESRFAIPPLAPIRSSGGLLESVPASASAISLKSPSSALDDPELSTPEDALSDKESLDVWITKPNEGVAQNLTFSWDTAARGPTTRGAFLSEQPARVFVASRYHVQPRLESASNVTRRFISPPDLLKSLKTTLLGATSLLFGWDKENAEFFVRSEKQENEHENTVLILGELSEESTMSLIEPFLQIGELLRRLDDVIASLQSPSVIPTARALAYSLQSTTKLIQSDMTKRLPATLTMTTLLRLSTAFNDIRAELDALAELCFCPVGESPPFAELPTTQAKLLDHLFLTLDNAFRHSAPYRIPSMLAYILNVSSQEFNDSLATTIGLTTKMVHSFKPLVGDEKTILPSFFPSRSRIVLENAARALDILQRADPGHPLCQKEIWTWRGPDWGWTDKDLHNIDARTRAHVRIIRRALNIWYSSTSQPASPAGSDNSDPSVLEDALDDTILAPRPDEEIAVPSSTRVYKPELQALFSVFDQSPGSHIPISAKGTLDNQLISKGPVALPFSAPTLSLVVDSSLLSLPLAHSRLVSSALLRVFTNRLAFKTHLKVVRGFLLGGDQVFWSRLRGALFEESGVSSTSSAVGRGVRAGVRVRLGIVDPARDQIADERAEREGRPREWGVGLAVGLSERGGPGSWPPGGAELGLRLRHVIDEALEVGWGAQLTTESDDESDIVQKDQDGIVLKETSWRLGFILRDLEEESAEGRARWLNPNAIEALDFLCLDYKPPDPIDVILTTEIRQKMHRVFTFLLRLLRVETVTKMLFNTMFQPLSNYPPVVLLARFRIQSFVSSLVGYTTDIAIGANWNGFLAALDEIQRDDEGSDEPTPRRDFKKDHLASDIFAVHAHLSTTMDRMLEACLLRARQRGVGNALKECMEAVLVLGKLVGDWCRDPSELLSIQNHFVLNVTKVLQRFDKLHTALVTALRALDMRGTATAGGNISSEDAQLLRRHEGENENPYGRMATWLDPIGRCVKPKVGV
ncbi:SPC97/SPC98 domain-containing protein [Ceratobasidium sp. AG-Ba]|nr:SPC97/SPC98 domain-containing protein [Ceratobasidium sp. AG-Ba]